MSGAARELVVLGTASQAPTRHRNHNGYLLRWDDHGILFDPGEGTQRQLVLAGVAASSITSICITHFHGDHCLGLPGVVQRRTLDRLTTPLDIHFPASGAHYVDRLLTCTAWDDRVAGPVRTWACEPGVVAEGPAFRLSAARLSHAVESFGWRLDEPDGRRMLPDRLDALGIAGPDVGRLQREGAVTAAGGRVVTLADVSEHRAGQRFAFVMDTGLCDAAFELALGVDVLVCESTFLSGEEEPARESGHLTAAQAARIALESDVRLLVLTHFSQRHPDERAYLEEARAVFPHVTAVRDLDRVPVPPRR